MKIAGRLAFLLVAWSVADGHAQYRPGGMSQPSYGRSSPYGGGRSYDPRPQDPRPQVPRPAMPGRSYAGSPYGRSPYGIQHPSPAGDMYLRLGSNAVQVKYCSACENVVPYHTSHNGQTCPHCRVHWNTAGAIMQRETSEVPEAVHAQEASSAGAAPAAGPPPNLALNYMAAGTAAAVCALLLAVLYRAVTGDLLG